MAHKAEHSSYLILYRKSFPVPDLNWQGLQNYDNDKGDKMIMITTNIWVRK